MNKTQYILRSLSKINKKRWEHYVVNRIYHRLNDPTIEFVCQQAIRHRDQSKIYLADLFFPQLDLYLEIDEGHHDDEINKIKDAIRRLDIEDAAGFEEFRIKASEADHLEALDDEIETFIQKIKERKAATVASGNFQPWNYERRFSPLLHLEAGYIEVGPHAAFRTHKDALKCFGYDKGHYQRGSWDLPKATVRALGEKGAWMVWFPKLYEYPSWSNSINLDRTEITERCNIPDHSYTERWDRRIVMAHARDELNLTLYRFLGVFEVIPAFREGSVHKFRRIMTRLPTVRPYSLRHEG